METFAYMLAYMVSQVWALRRNKFIAVGGLVVAFIGLTFTLIKMTGVPEFVLNCCRRDMHDPSTRNDRSHDLLPPEVYRGWNDPFVPSQAFAGLGRKE